MTKPRGRRGPDSVHGVERGRPVDPSTVAALVDQRLTASGAALIAVVQREIAGRRGTPARSKIVLADAWERAIDATRQESAPDGRERT